MYCENVRSFASAFAQASLASSSSHKKLIKEFLEHYALNSRWVNISGIEEPFEASIAALSKNNLVYSQ